MDASMKPEFVNAILTNELIESGCSESQKMSQKVSFNVDDINKIISKAEKHPSSLTKQERELLEAALKNASTPLLTRKRIEAVLSQKETKITEADPKLQAKSTPVETKSDKKEKIGEILDKTSDVLAAASVIPVVDTFADIASVPVDILRGDWTSAGLGLVGAVPYIGEVADAAKLARKADNAIDAMRVADDVNDVKKIIKATSSPHDLTRTQKLTLSKKQYSELTESIRKNGITEPIKYVEHNGTKYVVDGHHRLQVAKDLKLIEVPVEKVTLPYKGYKTVEDLLWME